MSILGRNHFEFSIVSLGHEFVLGVWRFGQELGLVLLGNGLLLGVEVVGLGDLLVRLDHSVIVYQPLVSTRILSTHFLNLTLTFPHHSTSEI